MAEARSEEDEENLRETRDRAVRRQAASPGGRPDRRKPEHRLSQGPLSSIRAAIKRTSNRSTSLSEAPPTERQRDRDRDRRRPQITILSAEPISSWFPGAGFPPPPPPAAQIWGPSLSSSALDVQPPSYEEVIREKNQEQALVPAAAAAAAAVVRPASLSSSPQHQSVCTIATQTDTGPPHDSHTQVSGVCRPPRPSSSKPPTHRDALDRPSPLSPSPSASSGPETVQSEPRPRPRPRSKLNLQPVRDEVKVQTLVKLREDGLKTLAAQRQNQQSSSQEVLGGKYLQELLEAFSSDDWGFPEQRGSSQSESEDESNRDATQRDEDEDEDEDEDMATLRARIQAFEQMHDGNFEDGARTEPCVLPKPRPEPKPRPRLPQNKPPVVSPKPKNTANSGDVSTAGDRRGSREDGGKTERSETSEKPQLAPKPEAADPAPSPRPGPSLPPRPSVAPRTKAGAASQDRGSSGGQTTPPLPPRPNATPTPPPTPTPGPERARRTAPTRTRAPPRQ
ncbi:hypothetical protein NL108_018243 [Boleophthalmus pectinirostris]|nr:hypothetical protein NL108_018243 [Boleophthalmus pectinirostris]